MFSHNWLQHADIGAAWPAHDQPWNTVHEGNEFSGSWRIHQPRASLSADALAGEVPLEVVFTADGLDPDGYPIDAFSWDYLDNREYFASASNQIKLRFEQPGSYTVKVRARNSYGLLSEPADLTVFVAPPAQPQAGLLDRLVAMWEFEDPEFLGEDSHWNGHDMDALGSPSDIPEAVLGRGVHFDGEFSGLCVSNQAAHPLQLGGEDLGLSLWMKADSAQSYHGIWGIGAGAGAGTVPGYYLTLRSTGLLYLFLASGHHPRELNHTGEPVIELGQFHHVVVNYVRDVGTQFFVDGELVVTRPTIFEDVHIYHGSMDICLGSRFSDYFEGDMDQVGLWKRGLSPDEVSWLYNEGLGRSYDELQ